MHTRRLALVALAWTAVVALGSTLVWTVISDAGRDLVSSDVTVGTAAETTGAAVPAPTTAGPSARPRKNATSAPQQPATSGGPGSPSAPTSTPDSSPQPPRQGSSPSSPATSGPTSPGTDPGTPPSASSPSQSTVRRTWQGAAGTVVAQCQAARMSLVGAQPNSGWSVVVEAGGPEELSVHFRRSSQDEDRDERAAPGRAEEDEGDEVEIAGRCVDGVPSFTVG